MKLISIALFGFLACFGPLLECASAKSEPPNFIIIFADDLGYGDLGCYGSTKNKTPRLDQMAAEGIRFTDFYVSGPVCTPSRASLMTGCYAQRVSLDNGVLWPGDSTGINSNEITIAELLKTRGYATMCIGKWHLGDQAPFLPTQHGFDSYFGLPYSNDMGAGNKNKQFPPLPLIKDVKVVETEPNQATLTERYADEAVRFIKANQARPFFLYLAHMYVHGPHFPPPKFHEDAADGDYGREVEYIDQTTGRILDALKELNLDKNTLVVFSSDNGSTGRNGSNLPLRGFKGQTYEGGMREPGIAWWPGKISAGNTCRELATTMDLLPTFSELSGAKLPSDRIIDGKNIWPLMSGKRDAKSPRDTFFYYRVKRLEAVRNGTWKLHLQRKELYDLASDIGEQNNLFDQQPKVVKKLTALAERCRADLGDGDFRGKNRRPPGRVENPTALSK